MVLIISKGKDDPVFPEILIQFNPLDLYWNHDHHETQKEDARKDENLAEKEKDIYEKDLDEAKILKDNAIKEVEEKKQICGECS